MACVRLVWLISAFASSWFCSTLHGQCIVEIQINTPAQTDKILVYCIKQNATSSAMQCNAMQCNATKVKCVHSSWLCNQPNAFLPPPSPLSPSPLCSPILPVSQLYHQDYPHLPGELRGGRTETLVEVQSKDSRPDVCTICTLVHWMHRYVCTICTLVHLMHTHTHICPDTLAIYCTVH